MFACGHKVFHSRDWAQFEKVFVVIVVAVVIVIAVVETHLDKNLKVENIQLCRDDKSFKNLFFSQNRFKTQIVKLIRNLDLKRNFERFLKGSFLF